MRIVLIGMLLTVLVISAFPAATLSAESGWNEAGIRIGIRATPRSEYFRQYDAFAVYGLPWEWHLPHGWSVTPNASLSLGILENDRLIDFIGSGATALALGKEGSGFTTDLGIDFNFLDGRHIGSIDFGSALLFGAYAGINYRFSGGLKVGYRLQHISNGHILYQSGTPNPGLDMHLFGISYAL